MPVLATEKNRRLQELLRSREFFDIVGVTNALQARLVELAGVPVTYVGGGIFTSHILGLPDIAFMSRNELIWFASRVSAVVDIPVLCDSDQGFGTAVQVRRTVHEFIQAGISGIHIEDQPANRRCGFLAGKTVCSIEEAVLKYKAAVAAKNELDPNFVIIARCDARTAVNGGLETTIERLKAYEAAGVDMLYFEGPQSPEEIKMVRAETKLPLIATLFGWSDQPDREVQKKWGLSATFFPELLVYPQNMAVYDFLQDWKKRGVAAYRDVRAKSDKHPIGGLRWFDFDGLREWGEWEKKYVPADQIPTQRGKGLGVHDPYEATDVKRQAADATAAD